MVAFLGFVSVVCCGLFLFFRGVPWILEEHRLANRYRALALKAQTVIKEKKNQPVAPITTSINQWKVVWKVGQKTCSGVFTGDTEGVALKKFLKTTTMTYDSIVSFTRCGS